MYYGEIAERVRFHKQETKGVGTVCRIVEEYGDERVAEVVEGMLRDGRLPIETIAAIAKVPLERVRQMAERLAVLAFFWRGFGG